MSTEKEEKMMMRMFQKQMKKMKGRRSRVV
jgi:hypothetical protein